VENINKKESMKLWEYLYQNKDFLSFFQGNWFDKEEVERKLNL